MHNIKAIKIISVLGKIVTPTTIIALFCTVLNVGSTETAVISIASVIITTVFLFYPFINTKLPSSILLFLLIILLVAFFFGYQNIIMKDTGLVKYYKQSAEVIGEIPENLKKTKHEVIFLGTNFHITSKDNRQIILGKLNEGIKIKYLIFNPLSPVMDFAAIDFADSKENLMNECITGLRNIMELKRDWEKIKNASSSPGEIEIRLYNEIPRLRGYIFDPQDENGSCIYIPYLYKVNSPELPGFKFKNSSNGVFKDYYSSILKLWQSSVPILEFEKKYPGIDSLINSN